MKSPDDYFRDWESEVFGYGYGTGEEHVLPALKAFMGAVTPEGSYDYRALESACGPVVAWLFINILCSVDAIDYGTSPRFGWLNDYGKALRGYIVEKAAEELYEIAAVADYDGHCYATHCNCEGEECRNPFLRPSPRRTRNTPLSGGTV